MRRGPRRTACGAPLPGALTVALLALGCAAEVPEPADDSAPMQAASTQPLPEPNLEPLEPAVRQALEEARSGLDDLVGSGATGAELGEAYGELGKLYYAHLLLEPAAAAFRNATVLAPDEFRWAYYLGRIRRSANQPAEARASFERALSIRPADAPTLVALGELALDADLPAEAESYFRSALATSVSAASAHVGLGRTAVAAGDFAEAVQRFESALAIQPEASTVHYSLGLAYRELGDVERARFHLARRGDQPVRYADPLMDEVRSLTTGARSHLLRAGQALGAGQVTRGIEELRQAVAADPTDATARVTLGALLAQRGEPERARELFEEALALDPGDARAHFNLGLLSSESGADDEAIRHFRGAVGADRRHARAAFQLATTLDRLGRSLEASAAYGRFVELEPGHESARLRQAVLLTGLGAHAEARSALEAARAALPESTSLTHALARLLATAPDESARDGRQALALANELVALSPGRIDFEHGQTLAMAYAELGQFERAVALQEAMLATAERQGLETQLGWLRDNLGRYRSGLPCRVAWPEGHPLLGESPREPLR